MARTKLGLDRFSQIEERIIVVVTKWVVGIEKDDWFCAGVGLAIIVLDIQSVSRRRWLWLCLTVAEVLPDSNKETFVGSLMLGDGLAVRADDDALVIGPHVDRPPECRRYVELVVVVAQQAGIRDRRACRVEAVEGTEAGGAGASNSGMSRKPDSGVSSGLMRHTPASGRSLAPWLGRGVPRPGGCIRRRRGCGRH